MECGCRSFERSRTHAILYNILSGDIESTEPRYSTSSRCRCNTHHAIRLRSRDSSLAAAGVLVKTVRFIASLPAFQQLPVEDQVLLLHHCWTPLFILGLAQERVKFEIEEEPVSSMLRKILQYKEKSQEENQDKNREEPTLRGVQNLDSCLRKLWSLDLSHKEYAYMKGTMIFNPDVPGLQVAPLVDALQREAQRALTEVLYLLHSGDGGNLGRVFLAVSSLQSVTPQLIIELFFRPLIGSAHFEHLITDMLFAQ